jgi:hypothetical protein
MTAAASQAVMQCCIWHQFWAQAAAVVQDMLHSRNQQLQPEVLRIAILGCCRGQGLNEAYTLLQQLKVCDSGLSSLNAADATKVKQHILRIAVKFLDELMLHCLLLYKQYIDCRATRTPLRRKMLITHGIGQVCNGCSMCV